jgi:hypothetical protein
MIRTCIASAGLLNFLLYFFSLKHGQLPRWKPSSKTTI